MGGDEEGVARGHFRNRENETELFCYNLAILSGNCMVTRFSMK